MMNSSGGPPPYPSAGGGGMRGGGGGGPYDAFNPVVTTSASDFNSTPLSHPLDSGPPLDPLNAMEKSLNEQVG